MQANQPTMIVMASQPIYTPPPKKKKKNMQLLPRNIALLRAY